VNKSFFNCLICIILYIFVLLINQKPQIAYDLYDYFYFNIISDYQFFTSKLYLRSLLLFQNLNLNLHHQLPDDTLKASLLQQVVSFTKVFIAKPISSICT